VVLVLFLANVVAVVTVGLGDCVVEVVVSVVVVVAVGNVT